MEELCQLTYVPIPPAFLCAIFMLLTTYNNSFLHNLNTYLVSNTDTGSLIIGGDWNVTLEAVDKKGGVPWKPTIYRDKVVTMMEELHLCV